MPSRSVPRSRTARWWSQSQPTAMASLFGCVRATSMPGLSWWRLGHINGRSFQRSLVDAIADASFTLLVLRAVIKQTDGRSSLTAATARWVEAIHRVAPDLDPWNAYRLARLYVARADAGNTTNLDAWLAYAPWRSD